MSFETILAVVAILLAIGFDFVNGFHDTANAVSTVIYTKALKPNYAILLSGLLNFLGALLVGTQVALVITRIVPADSISLSFILSSLLASLLWNLITWWYGIPVSSSHCLIGSLFGSGLLACGFEHLALGELKKVLLALLISPILGFTLGSIITYLTLKISREKLINNQKDADNHDTLTRYLHIFACATMSFSHGGNDGQKTMGIITLILAVHFAKYGYDINHVPLWVITCAALAISLGTVIGGWRVIRTIGTKISREKMTHSQGFGACFSTAIISLAASFVGAPISTTHTLSSSVAGATIPVHGVHKLNFTTIKLILLAWLLTLPVAICLSACLFFLIHNIIGIK